MPTRDEETHERSCKRSALKLAICKLVATDEFTDMFTADIVDALLSEAQRRVERIAQQQMEMEREVQGER